MGAPEPAKGGEAELTLEVWRLHPNGVRIVPADKHLMGEAPRLGVKWCGPFTNANKAGWWVYPPLDIDIVYRPPDGRGTYEPKFDEDPEFHSLNRMEGYFDYEVGEDYTHEEVAVIKSMLKRRHRYRKTSRVLYDFGNAEMNVANIWTGCVFKTPPGWCLHIRSPINLDLDQPFRIQEAILETDWMRYDIWMNLKFFRYNDWARIRRGQHYPIAQLVPVRRESYDARWGLSDTLLSREGPHAGAGEEIFDGWNEYNAKKWETGDVDRATHHKLRKKRGY
ncbi:MAG: DUF6065 family protein [Acidobacteria bacterium]|nr:DUF6065 family protein [Acidobacteriota bacterium]